VSEPGLPSPANATVPATVDGRDPHPARAALMADLPAKGRRKVAELIHISESTLS